ncbi:MAG: recombinase RecA [Limnochordaceae bacterium]|nr:recombinase RecA [Limnochordaceae bacterium]
MVSAEKAKALELAMLQIEKQFGRGSIMRLGEASAHQNVEVIPTGSLTLDLALGIGGVPRGRVIEVYGPESSGKTTLCLHVMAEAQRLGGVAAFIDAEHAQDPAYARNVGVDIDNLLISQPDSAEQALEIAEALVRSGAVDVIVIDSVAALVPRAELEGEMGDSHVGLQARLMSQALRKLTGAISRSRTTVIFTNQIREKVGVMFGNPEVTPGGRALKFYASIRLEIRRVEAIKQGNDTIGARTRIKVVKNKLAPPFREAECDILYGTGISYEGGVIDVALDLGVVQRSGAWFSYGDTRLGQGRENVRETLIRDPQLCLEIENRCRQELGVPLRLKPVRPTPPPAADLASNQGETASLSTSTPSEGAPKGVEAAPGEVAASGEPLAQPEPAEGEPAARNERGRRGRYGAGNHETVGEDDVRS